MKKIILLFIAYNLFLSIPIFSQIPTNGLVAYYPFNGNANDGSGNGNNGTVTGAVLTSDRFNQPNKAYKFDGTQNNVIDCGNATSLQSSDVTVSCWFKYAGTLPISPAPTIVTKANKGSDGWSIFQNEVSAVAEPSKSGSWQAIYVGDTVKTNVWYNLIFTYNSSITKATIYWNGNLKSYITFQMSPATTKNLQIGNGYDTKGNLGTKGFNGAIDDIRIYNRALTETEISALYHENGWTGQQGLVAYYPLDGNPNDLSGNNNNGTIMGGVYSTTDRFGNQDKAMQFNGTNGYIEIPNSSSLQSPTSAITITAWICINDFPAGQVNVAGIVNKTKTSSYGQYGFNYQAWDSPSRVAFNHSGGTGGWSFPDIISFLNWHFMAATFDGNVVVYYRDGIIIGTKTNPGAIIPDNNPLTIGLDSPGQTEFLHGKLDDIRIYNISLTETEITALYHENGWVPTYTASLCHDIQTDSMHYEFDVYLRSTGAAPFELSGAQLGLTYNAAVLNGGSLTASWVPGSTDPSIINSGQMPDNPNMGTSGIIEVAPKSPNGGPGSGAIISSVFPGTKLGRMRLTNSVTFAVVQPNIAWNFNTTPYPTIISANISGTSTDITVPTDHKYCTDFDNGWGNPTCPVELSSFTTVHNGRTLQLNWETKTEKNSDKFNIERKTIGTDWGLIGSVKASVLSNSPKQYSFTDKNLQTGKYNYRLKMIDNDGTFEYSKVIETEIALPKKFELSQNYPNPFNPSTKINYSLPFDSKVTLDVYNITGARVRQLVNEVQLAGYYTVDFGSSNLSSGVYFYRITSSDKATGNNFSAIKKMMLLK